MFLKYYCTDGNIVYNLLIAGYTVWEIAKMLDFCSRHAIEQVVEEFPLSCVNEALSHPESGKARYLIVLRNDFK